MGLISCPHCGHSPIEAPRNGDEIGECSECGRSFAFPTATPELPEEVAPRPAMLRGRTRAGGPTDVPMMTSGLLGAALAALFYLAIVTPMRDSYFGQLFASRGWVPYIITLFSCWAIVSLALKLQLFRHQLMVAELDLLPTSLGKRITPANAHIYTSYLEHLGANGPKSFLIQRLIWAMRHFRVRGDARELANQLMERSRNDADVVDSSYSMLRVLVWAIPILGFIGTVLGIGESVSAFSSSVAGAADLDVMKDSIGSVTTGLGVAFDTTLLALVMSIIIMLPTSSLQKAEEDHLTSLEDYCDEHLICRLDDSASDQTSSAEARGAARSSPPNNEVGRLIDALSGLERRIGRLEPPREGY